MPQLTLAHSGDPDDAFMWWPITGKVHPDGSPHSGAGAQPAIDTGGWRFSAVPGDIAQFNRLAAGVAPYDITALSVRAYADVAGRYVVTRCGSSFGEGYGPKVVVPEGSALREELDLARDGVTIAVPGLRTSACLTLSLLLGRDGLGRVRLAEAPFDRIIPEVVEGRADAGLIIHEGQVMFARAGLRQIIDLGEWWRRTRELPLPLGVNAVKRDLDSRFGPGSLREVSAILRQSLAHALAHRDESVEYTMPYAASNARAAGLPTPSRETVEKYLAMYVTQLTQDMGEIGQRAIRRLLSEGAAMGLSPAADAEDAI